MSNNIKIELKVISYKQTGKFNREVNVVLPCDCNIKVYDTSSIVRYISDVLNIGVPYTFEIFNHNTKSYNQRLVTNNNTNYE